MSQVHSDRNLLFGILALQLDFITRDALIVGMNSWVLDKARSLSEILRAQGALSASRAELIESLVSEHLIAHCNDAAKSLAAVGHVRPAVRGLASMMSDVDVQSSLAFIDPNLETSQSFNSGEPEGDLYATRQCGASRLMATRFEVLRPHARGGLGEVYLAKDRELNREVALKQIRPHRADDTECRARFLREAQITGALEHPGIVPIYALSTHADGRPFYAMRFIRGESLEAAADRFHSADGIQGGGQAEKRHREFRGLLRRFVTVCNTIAYAHSRGIIHRDLKPSNVMLGDFGETLVVDWGLATSVLGRGQEPPGATAIHNPLGVDDLGHTTEGAILGTPQFMSPEQAAGNHDLVGPPSDVYALGATLYYLIAGRAPFEERTLERLLVAVRSGSYAPPRRVKQWISPQLESICLEAMALAPEDRYPSALALADDLERLLADQPITAQGAAGARFQFEQFFAPELTTRLSSSPDLLACRETEVTIMFVGLRDFSLLCEQIGTRATFELLSEVADMISEVVVHEGGGVVDRIGDEVMAMWGAPEEQADHATRACRAALAITARQSLLNEKWGMRIGHPLQMSIGLCTGAARVGGVGSDRQFKYSALGNTVDLASRVKTAARHFGTAILLTESTRSAASSEFLMRRIRTVGVVNTAEPVTLHELLPADTPSADRLVPEYEAALRMFERRRFKSAQAALIKLLADFPEDGPSLVLLGRLVEHPDHMPERQRALDRVWELPGK